MERGSQLYRQTALGRCLGRSDEGAEGGAIPGPESGSEEGFGGLVTGTEILRIKIAETWERLGGLDYQVSVGR